MDSNFRFRARRNRFLASGTLSMFLKLFVFYPDAVNQPHMPRRGFVRQGLPISSKIAASEHKTPSALSYALIGSRLGYRGSHHNAKG